MALYPPIVASSMPAFDIEEGKVRIYYSLSNYNVNKKDEIKNVHATIRRQSSNVNVTNGADYLTLEFGLQTALDKTLNRYYVEITNDNIIDGFEADVLYKVQLRFSSGSTSSSTDTSDISKLSEWSTVCIIKPINAPLFYIDEFFVDEQHYPPKEQDDNTFYNSLADFTGVFKPNKKSAKQGNTQKDGTQSLRRWRMILLQPSYTEEDLDSEDAMILSMDDYIIEDSGWILNKLSNYSLDDNSSVLSCSLPYELKEENDDGYKLKFEIQTKSGYTSSVMYSFHYRKINTQVLHGQLKTYINEEEGYIKAAFNFQDTEEEPSYIGNLVLRRSDATSGFKKWQDIKYIESVGDPSFIYYDFTVQSGTFYRYLVQKIDIRGRRGTPTYDNSRIESSQTLSSVGGLMGEWEHAFLLESTGNSKPMKKEGDQIIGDLSGTKQLKLKYDLQISSYKTNIAQSRTDTIGSKYPYIRRNGNMYYRSFPITGTITQFMDDADLFTNSQELFNNRYDQYQMYKGIDLEDYDSYIYHVNQYDYTYERKFREKVEQFLYNSKPKLYKSMQQGNIFIKLMQVSLTPKNELGRLVYSFSATAYEIDEPILQNFDKYNLISIGQLNPQITDTRTVLKQVNGYSIDDDAPPTPFPAGKDIIGAGQEGAAANSIANSLGYKKSDGKSVVNNFSLDWIRLEMESDPYLIIKDSKGNLIPYPNQPADPDIGSPIISKLYQMESTYSSDSGDIDVYLGWLFKINGQDIVISPPNNIYEIKEDNFLLSKNTSIIPMADTVMSISYRSNYDVADDISKYPKYVTVDRLNGQLIGTFTEDIELINRIIIKHTFTYNSNKGRNERTVTSVNSVLVDTQPGTVIELSTRVLTDATTGQPTVNRFIVNFTGQLNFDPEDSDVTINSLRIKGMNVLLSRCREVNSDYQYPIDGDYYSDNGSYYYYYKSAWREATLEDDGTSLDVSYPIDASVFYYISLKEEIY